MPNEYKETIQTTQGNHHEKKNLYIILLFWLKILFGSVGGASYYYIQRVLFNVGFFNVHYLFRGLLIISILLIYLIIINCLIVFIMNQVKKNVKRLVPPDASIWRFSLRFSIIFFIVFLISGSIMFYIGI
ncbi:MAG: hypothetical protein ACW986_02710 [Promethearchaeota archaeon]|jgi:hypothetical protein